MALRFVAALALVACGGPPSAAPPQQLASGSAVPVVVDAAIPAPPTLPARGVLSARSAHVCARTSDKRVACWGQLAPPRTVMGGSYFAKALNPSWPTIVPGLDHVLGVAAGDSIRCAWNERGEVWCWGWTDLTTERAPARHATLTEVVEIDGGDLDYMFCARTRRGNVACWGDPRSRIGLLEGTPTTIPQLDDAIEIAVAYEHGCARRANGEVVCWAGSAPDRLFPIAEARGAISLAGAYRGKAVFAALLPDGRTVEFERPLGKVTSGPTVAGGRSISIGRDTCVAGKKLICWNPDRPDAIAPPLEDVTHVATGGDVSCARVDTGFVFCWGARGSRGDGSTAVSYDAVEVASLTGVEQIAVDSFTSCARLATGRVACWGNRLQDTSRSDKPTPEDATPVELPGITNAIDLVLSDGTGCVRLADKRTACWGWDQSPAGRTLTKPTIIPKLANIGPLFEGPCGMRDGRRVCLTARPIEHAARWAQLPGAQRFWNGGFARHSWTCARATGGVSCLHTHHGRGYTDVSPDKGFHVMPDAIAVLRVFASAGQCVLRASGTVACHDLTGALVDITDHAVAVSYGPSGGVCALIDDGTVKCWGETLGRDRPAPIVTPLLTDAVELAGGGYHACARRKTGTVACWGDWSRLGNRAPSVDHGLAKGSY